MKGFYPTDSHRLMYHVERVAAWKEGKQIFPIYVEMSPSGLCNHRCIFCAVDFMGYRNRFLDTGKTITAIKEMARLGVKAIMFGGEGEPLLHKDIDKIALEINASGIDLGITTNGSCMGIELSEILIMNSRWIKVSVNAGNEEDYHKIHKQDQWERVWENIQKAVEYRNRKQNEYGERLATIGVQVVLIEENKEHIEELIQKSIKVGTDYVVIKPYSQHPSSNNKIKPVLGLIPTLRYKAYEDLRFKVIVRERAIFRQERNYSLCRALPFWSYIDSGGNVWSCSAMMPDERVKIGNIYNDAVEKIWDNGNLPIVNTKDCRVNCRMDECNRYLEGVSNPSPEVNFI